MALEDKSNLAGVELGNFPIEEVNNGENLENSTEQISSPEFVILPSEVKVNDESISTVEDLGAVEQGVAVGQETPDAVVENSSGLDSKSMEKKLLSFLNGDVPIPIDGKADSKMGSAYDEVLGYPSDSDVVLK